MSAQPAVFVSQILGVAGVAFKQGSFKGQSLEPEQDRKLGEGQSASVRLAAVPSPERARVCASQYLQTNTVRGAYIMDWAAVLAHI